MSVIDFGGAHRPAVNECTRQVSIHFLCVLVHTEILKLSGTYCSVPRVYTHESNLIYTC